MNKIAKEIVILLEISIILAFTVNSSSPSGIVPFWAMNWKWMMLRLQNKSMKAANLFLSMPVRLITLKKSQSDHLNTFLLTKLLHGDIFIKFNAHPVLCFETVNKCSFLPALLNLLCHKTGVQVKVEALGLWAGGRRFRNKRFQPQDRKIWKTGSWLPIKVMVQYFFNLLR